jgi:hypothetical protein
VLPLYCFLSARTYHMDKASNEISGNNAEDTRLIITAAEALLPTFFRLIQSGFTVKAVTGVSIRAFLCGQVGLPEDYFEERIQTLFLDSKPVDDAATALIRDGSRLALSAAMPGVAGALFRKGGRYSAMRNNISYKTQGAVLDEKTGWVTIKLFNLVLKELGPFFFAKGIWIDGTALQDFFNPPPESLLGKILKVEVNGNAIGADALLNQEWSEKHVFTKILSG